MAKILLIEDEPQVRGLLKETLVQEGHEVTECEDGADGLRHYKKGLTDLVILDMILPEKDGFETLTELRQQDPQVNVLAISGGFAPGAVNVLHIAQRLGAREILAKPFDLKNFLTVVNQLLTVPEPPA
ncbi:MAG: response regulator [Nitrospirae bacterium]|nr:response regulator [Nitrospirota bacterium]MDA1303224.1 response regulator [Nitrospirota bacterium]